MHSCVDPSNLILSPTRSIEKTILSPWSRDFSTNVRFGRGDFGVHLFPFALDSRVQLSDQVFVRSKVSSKSDSQWLFRFYSHSFFVAGISANSRFAWYSDNGSSVSGGLGADNLGRSWAVVNSRYIGGCLHSSMAFCVVSYPVDGAILAFRRHARRSEYGVGSVFRLGATDIKISLSGPEFLVGRFLLAWNVNPRIICGLSVSKTDLGFRIGFASKEVGFSFLPRFNGLTGWSTGVVFEFPPCN